MSQRTTTPRLGEAFSRALMFAADKHGTQVRKGGDIPYLGHLLSVAGLVIEADGTENQAIAALLHDAVEDAEDGDGESMLAEIRGESGDEVAGIVGECSDTAVAPKPPWNFRSRRRISTEARSARIGCSSIFPRRPTCLAFRPRPKRFAGTWANPRSPHC